MVGDEQVAPLDVERLEVAVGAAGVVDILENDVGGAARVLGAAAVVLKRVFEQVRG